MNKPTPSSLLLTVDDVGGHLGSIGRLLCPVCGFECTHTTGSAEPDRRPLGDSDVTLQIDCEAGHRTVITFIQHKGDTDVFVKSMHLNQERIGFWPEGSHWSDAAS